MLNSTLLLVALVSSDLAILFSEQRCFEACGASGLWLLAAWRASLELGERFYLQVNQQCFSLGLCDWLHFVQCALNQSAFLLLFLRECSHG